MEIGIKRNEDPDSLPLRRIGTIVGTDDMADGPNPGFKGFEIHRPQAELAADVQSELQRILASPIFGRAERPGRFLRFLVDRTLAGETNALTEWILAVEVFDRQNSFDPTTDPIVRVEASRLRRKLQDYYSGPGTEDPIVIELPQRTYVPTFTRRKPAAEAPMGGSRVSKRRSVLLAGGVVAILGGVAVFWTLNRPAKPPLQAVPEAARSIVVLPFKDLSPNHTDEYFCDGLTEELTETLTKVEGLQVVAGTSAFQFKGRSADVREIGRRLNVRLALEGSVRKDQDRVRVSAQLVSTADGFHLWSRSYDRKITDILSVQEEIARGIAASVSSNLSSRFRAPTSKSPNSAEAYDLYLRGLYSARRWDHESLKAAVADFERCIDLDVNYAPAHAALAEYLSLLGVHAGLAPRAVMPKAKSAALKAVELDNWLSRAHASLGLVKAVYDWDWPGAELSFRRAFELDPTDPNLHEMYVMGYLVPMGRLDEAANEINEARSLDPISPRIEAIQGMIYYFRRDYDRALEQLKKPLALEPNFYAAHLVMGSTYEQKASFIQAIASLEEGEAAWRSGIGPSMLGHTYALMGRRADAEHVIRQLVEKSATRYISPAYVATIYAGLNDADRTMEWLEKAYEMRSASLVFLKVNPRYDRVRSDPRFSALLKRIHLD